MPPSRPQHLALLHQAVGALSTQLPHPLACWMLPFSVRGLAAPSHLCCAAVPIGSPSCPPVDLSAAVCFPALAEPTKILLRDLLLVKDEYFHCLLQAARARPPLGSSLIISFLFRALVKSSLTGSTLQLERAYPAHHTHAPGAQGFAGFRTLPHVLQPALQNCCPACRRAELP